MSGRYFSLLACFLAAPALADECDQLPTPSVRLERLETQVATNLDYSYKTLNNLGASLHRPGRQILGLTRGNAVVRYQTRLHSRKDPSGRWECASPEITVAYGFNPITIYVASEFPPGSCAFNEIRAHELRHVQTYREHAAAIEREIGESLQKRFADGFLWRGPSGSTQEKLRNEMSERWLPYIKRLLETVESKQALIDTPEEYRRVGDSCQGEISRRIR